ncbi:4-(cytidine 5'-diphospho)-2-C-methyl-D-erythritol kinase [Patescibacteria group bacterium]
MIKYAFAKVNIALDILGKDKTGYHQIQTIFEQLPLMDEIIFSVDKGEGKFNVRFRGEEAKLIDPANNTVIDAIKALNEFWTFKNDYDIIVDKNIPLGAGLGGGSSDAAEIIKALNEREIMKLSPNEMRDIGKKIGMDVPFFIEGETAFGTNYGEEIKILTKLSLFPEWNKKYKILVIPQLRNSTEKMYAKVDLAKCGANKAQTENILKNMEADNPGSILEDMHNDFENFANSGFAEIKAKLTQNGAKHVILCGSGSALLALSSSQFDLKALSQVLPHQRILSLSR